MDLAQRDWRDLPVAADLADEGWPSALSAWLGPPQPTDVASPSTMGELVEADGRRWLVRRRRIDLRVVNRLLLRRADIVVVLGETGGVHPRRIASSERASVWQAVRRAYAGPGGSGQIVESHDYVGYEFTDGEEVILYLEERC
jgi:hypothetical protein